MIGFTPPLMRNYQLSLETNKINLKEAASLDRRFEIAKVNSLCSPIQEILKLHNLRSLDITNCTIERQSFVKTLQHTKRLESLSLSAVQTTTTNEIPIEPICDIFEPVQLCNLKKLSFKSSDIRLISLISTSTLTHILIDSSSQREEFPKVMKLLELQSSLERLALSGSLLLESFFNYIADNFPFKLKSLHVNSKLVSNCDIDKGLMKFLIKHEASLEELLLECPVKASVLKFVFHLKSLKALKIPVFDLSEEEPEFFDDIQPVTNVTRLETFECFKNYLQAKLILRLFPSLDELSMKNVSTINEFKDFPYYISGQLQQLKVLHVHNLSCQVDMRRYKFDYLKELDIAQHNKENHVASFVRRHSKTIEKLTIGWINDYDLTRELTSSAIMDCTKLKSISICSNLRVFTKMFHNVSFSYHWTLEWNFKKYYYSPKTQPGVRYKFPDDLASFQDEFKSFQDILKQDLSYDGANIFLPSSYEVMSFDSGKSGKH